MSDEVWRRIAVEHPCFERVHDAAGNYHAVREIVLGGSLGWSGFHQRFQPRPGNLVLDAGANAGIFSAFCAVYGARVVAYEPFDLAFSLLSKAAQFCSGRISCIRAALWTHTGTCPFVGRTSILDSCPAVNGYVQSKNILWPPEAPGEGIPCVSLEQALDGHNWDCVKMDIEGAEYETILATPVASLQRIKFMFLELHPTATAELYRETLKKLQSIYRVEHGPESVYLHNS